MKQILLPLLGVALFIVAVGIFTNKIQNQKVNLSAKKEIKVGSINVAIEVADSEEERKMGLSGRKSLGENDGMLFKFDKNDVFPSFWMKDMLIPIDIVWINDGKIAKIHKNVQPQPGKKDSELTLYSPDLPIDYVLEVNTGFSDKNGLKVEDRVDLSGI